MGVTKEKPAEMGVSDGPGNNTADDRDSEPKAAPAKQEKSPKPDPATVLLSLPHTAAYLRRIGAVVQSQRAAVVKDTSGKYPKIIATIRFEKMKGGKRDKDGTWEVDAPIGYEPTEAEASVIKAELATVKWAEWLEYFGRFDKADLPSPYRDLPDEAFFICRKPERDPGAGLVSNDKRKPEAAHPIIMIQMRIEKPDGSKATLPLTWWNDRKWHILEPERKLPVFGMEQFADNFKEVMFLHEGPKAARAARQIVEAFETAPSARTKVQQELASHPWAFDLAAGIHLGWIGGALRPWGTDWVELRNAAKKAGIKLVVIVADNDKPGREALPKISEGLGMVVDHLLFPDKEFRLGFDLADPWPMVDDTDDETGAKVKRPSDRTMREFLLPGTFMTKMIHPPEGKKLIPILTEAGSGEFAYIPENELYASIRHPHLTYDKSRLNAYLRPLSHSKDTADLIQQSAYATGRAMRLEYNPGLPEGVISDGEGPALNQHRPSNVKSKAGTAEPFLEFLKYLVPGDQDRHQLMRWTATLIAKPERKMIYGLLLITEAFGIGKNTFANILADLVGQHNTSYPGENDLLSDFKEWPFEKRLAVCSEIYAGHSWAAYNKLKTYVTDKKLTLNRKHMRQITMNNWVHIIGCSNSPGALKVPNADRRWFIPELTEMKQSREKFATLLNWLKDGGLGEIKYWAENFGDYVLPGETAPDSEAKKRIVRESRSEAAKAIVRLAEVMNDNDVALAVTVRSLRPYAKIANGNAWVKEPDTELATLMKEGGIEKYDRIKVNGTLETVLINAAAKKALDAIENDDPEERKKAQNAKANALIKMPSDIQKLDM